MAPRFEFRVFGADIAGAWEILRRDGRPAGGIELRTDTYFVVSGRTDASLKLRGDRLDLKILLREEERLELWQPGGAADFPVASGVLRAQFLEPAGLRLDLGATPVGRDALLALASASPGMRVVAVGKRRQQYRFEDAMAERAELSIEGAAVRSVAVEDAERSRAARALAALGLADRLNVSYQRFLVEASFPSSV